MQSGNLFADILGLGSRSLYLYIILYYRPSVVAVFFLPLWLTSLPRLAGMLKYGASR